jgi:hypothetical protein
METMSAQSMRFSEDHRWLTAERSDLLVVSSLSRSFTGVSLLLVLQT